MALRRPSHVRWWSVGENQPTTDGLTRRELLKRGAVLGGALAWATPAVQLIGMQPALAAHVSDVCFCVKNDPPGSDSFEPLSETSNGECLSAVDESCTGEIPELNGEFEVIDNNDGSYTIKYPANCHIIAVSVKCGSGAPGHDCEATPCGCQHNVDPDPGSPVNGFNYFTVSDDDCQEGAGSISHIEICFRC